MIHDAFAAFECAESAVLLYSHPAFFQILFRFRNNFFEHMLDQGNEAAEGELQHVEAWVEVRAGKTPDVTPSLR